MESLTNVDSTDTLEMQVNRPQQDGSIIVETYGVVSYTHPNFKRRWLGRARHGLLISSLRIAVAQRILKLAERVAVRIYPKAKLRSQRVIRP